MNEEKNREKRRKIFFLYSSYAATKELLWVDCNFWTSFSVAPSTILQATIHNAFDRSF